MILGIGTDIIDTRRIKKVINRYGEKFKKRCFTNKEIKRSENNFNTSNSYAKRYAAKSLCTWPSKGIFWKDVEVVNDKYGKPFIKLHNNALKRINKITKKDYNIEVSLSDEKNYAIANVIIFIDEKYK